MSIRLNIPAARVLAVLLADPAVPRYGFDLMEATGLPSGTLYPVLSRFERDGWVSGTWESVDPRAEGRPRRRYYTLTDKGIRVAGPWLDELIEMLRR